MITDIEARNNTGSEIKPPIKVNVGPEGLFTGQKMSSAIDKFVERGDEVEDLILRSDFTDVDQGVAWIRQLRKARHYKDKEYEDMLMNYISMLPAIHARRIKDLKDAVIGAHSVQEGKSFGSKLRQWAGMDKPGDMNGK